MRRLIEVTAFIALSAAVHAGVVFQLDGTRGSDGQGQGGTDRITMVAAPDSMAALMDQWDTAPPQMEPVTLPMPEATPAALSPVQPDIAMPSLPTPDSIPAPSPDSAPDMQIAREMSPPRPDMAMQIDPLTRSDAPDSPTMPDMASSDSPARPAPLQLTAPTMAERPDVAPPPPPAPSLTMAAETSPRPVTRPNRPPPASTAQPARVASGEGGSQTQGAAPAPSPQPSLTPSQRQSLMAQWGGQILSRIERNRPRVRVTGQVLVQLRIQRNGTLAGLSVARSSGDPVLDQAAMAAVQGAGRFPTAPDGLTEPTYGFSLPIRFR